MVNEWKGFAVGEKRVEESEDSVAEKRWVRRSKTAIWWISLWMWGTSEGVARRMRVKIGWPTGAVSGRPVAGSGAGAGGGGGAAAAIGWGRGVLVTVLHVFEIFCGEWRKCVLRDRRY